MPKTMKHKCEVCNKAFPDKSKFTRHMQSHTTKRPHGCDVCGRKFRLLHHLKEHARTHTGEKAFAQSSTLASHIKTHDPRSELLYICPTCGTAFAQESFIKFHMQYAHPNPTTAVTTESHEEPAGTVTTTTHSFSTGSGTTSVSYIQSPNTEKKAPVQVVIQSTGPIETTTVTQSSGTVSYSQSFDAFQEELARGLPDLEGTISHSQSFDAFQEELARGLPDLE